MNAPQAMTVANDQTLVEMIQKAERRLIYMAPGMSKLIARAIAQRWQVLGESAVTVIVDLDPEIFRLGYGELEAVQLLKKAALEVRAMVNSQKGVRIGLLIVDDEAMVFAPTPLLIEASPQRPAENAKNDKPLKPNAILLGLPPAGIERDLGAGPEGNMDRVVGMDQADRESMEAAEKDLKRNPPLKFDVARMTLTYKALIQFVEFELSGAMLGRRTVTLPSYLLAIEDEDTRKIIRTTIQLIDPAQFPQISDLLAKKEAITRKYLVTIPGYGRAIRRTQKLEFENEVAQLRQSVKTLKSKARQEIQKQIDTTRTKLVNALLPAIEKNPPHEWTDGLLGGRLTSAELREELDEDIRDSFGTADSLIKQMGVKTNYKDVTYESLNDPKFLQKVRNAMPDLRVVHEEQIMAPSSQPSPQAA